MIFFLPAETPQNYTVDRQKLQISELHFDKFPTLSTFSCCKIRFKTQVSSCSDSHSEAMLCIKEVEMVDSVDGLKSSHSIQGYSHLPNCEMLDARIASEQDHPELVLQEEGQLEEQKAQNEDRFLRGRQIAYMIYDYFRVTGAHDTILDYADLFIITLRNDDVQEFDTRWDELQLSMSKIPSDDVLESVCKLRIRESFQRKTVLELYDMEIHQKVSMPKYRRLKTMVKRNKDQKLRLRNFDARNERIEIGAVFTNRRGLRGVESGPGECHQWKAQGQCSRGDSCSFRHDENKRAKPTPKSALLSSEPPTDKDGRSTSRRKRLRGWSPSGKLARQPCRDCIEGKCTRPSCDFWHPPECQFYKKKGCKFGDKCTFIHRQVEDQPSKKPKKDGDKSAVAILKDARQMGCVSQDIERPESS